MTVRATDPDSVELPLGGVWSLAVAVTDPDGCPVDDTVTVTVTPPSGGPATPTVEATGNTGAYRATYVTSTAGRYVARATSLANGACDFTAYVAAASTFPTLEDLRGDPDADPPTLGYLKRTSATDEQITEALDSEAASQRRMCRLPAVYSADLRSALLRRVARHLAMLGIPLAVLQGDAETGSTIPPSQDPEVRRFERPYRRLKVG